MALQGGAAEARWLEMAGTVKFQGRTWKMFFQDAESTFNGGAMASAQASEADGHES